LRPKNARLTKGVADPPGLTRSSRCSRKLHGRNLSRDIESHGRQDARGLASAARELFGRPPGHISARPYVQRLQFSRPGLPCGPAQGRCTVSSRFGAGMFWKKIRVAPKLERRNQCRLAPSPLFAEVPGQTASALTIFYSGHWRRLDGGRCPSATSQGQGHRVPWEKIAAENLGGWLRIRVGTTLAYQAGPRAGRHGAVCLSLASSSSSWCAGGAGSSKGLTLHALAVILIVPIVPRSPIQRGVILRGDRGQQQHSHPGRISSWLIRGPFGGQKGKEQTRS